MVEGRKLSVTILFLSGWVVAGCGNAPEPRPTLLAATPSAAPTPLFVEFRDDSGVEMVFVPAGEFPMGSHLGDPDERPVHTVYLDAFYIDKFEVTNARYRACVEAGACTPPTDTASFTRPDYYGNPAFEDFPVVSVTWEMAQTYCAWRGPAIGSGTAHLPSEAQWEKAARGSDGRTYPWGEGIDCQRANFHRREGVDFAACTGDTTRIGSYPGGASPYGAQDLAGNVWEWVADWYGESTYKVSLSSNPSGPETGRERVIRGGSWLFSDYTLRAANRYWFNPANAIDSLGFRCARDVKP